MLKIHKEDPNLAEGDVLVGPEVLVPVLRVLPQVSETFLQLGFVLRDVIHNWPEVGKRVWRPNPVMCGAGFWSLHVHEKTPECGFDIRQPSSAAGGDVITRDCDLKRKPLGFCPSVGLVWSCTADRGPQRTAVEEAVTAQLSDREASILDRPLLVYMPF